MSGVLLVERLIEAPPDQVWQAMIRPESAERWLEAKGFRAEQGARFTARLPRGPGFDGNVQAEVLEVHAPHELRMWWSSAKVSGEVRVALEATDGGGTRVTIRQTGFDQAHSAVFFPAFSAAWASRLAGPLTQATLGGAAQGATAASAGTSVLLAGVAGITAMVVLLIALLGWFVMAPSLRPGRGDLAGTSTAEASTAALTPAAPEEHDEPSPSHVLAERPTPAPISASFRQLTLHGSARTPQLDERGRFVSFILDIQGRPVSYVAPVDDEEIGEGDLVLAPVPDDPSRLLDPPVWLDGEAWFTRGDTVWRARPGAEAEVAVDRVLPEPPAVHRSQSLLATVQANPDRPGDGVVRVWSARTGSLVASLLSPSGPKTELRFSHDGESVAYVIIDQGLYAQDVYDGEPERLHPSGRHPVAVRDGFVFVAPGDKGLHLYDSGAQQLDHHVQPSQAPVAADPSGEVVAFVDPGLPHRVQLLNLRTGRRDSHRLGLRHVSEPTLARSGSYVLVAATGLRAEGTDRTIAARWVRAP